MVSKQKLWLAWVLLLSQVPTLHAQPAFTNRLHDRDGRTIDTTAELRPDPWNQSSRNSTVSEPPTIQLLLALILPENPHEAVIERSARVYPLAAGGTR